MSEEKNINFRRLSRRTWLVEQEQRVRREVRREFSVSGIFCVAGGGCFEKDPCRGGACFVACAACKHCEMLAVAKLQATAEMHEPEARFSEPKNCVHQADMNPIRGLFLMPKVQNLVPYILEVLTKQMHLRGIGAGGTGESRSGGGGWTDSA